MEKPSKPHNLPIQGPPLALADSAWLALIDEARRWFAGPLGQLLLSQQQQMLEQEMARLFGGYLLHYGPAAETLPDVPHIQRCVRVGAPFNGVDIICDEQHWPFSEHAADVVVVQHGLDFSLSPHGLLREAARSVRPGGHLLVLGINPLSAWGARHLLARDALHKAQCIAPNRVADWLSLLGFALEKRRFGCYRPPLSSAAWQARLSALERLGGDWQVPGGGFYLLVARKLVLGMRPVRQRNRHSVGQLIPMPVAKVSRRQPPETPPS
jgi:SAM-dependent methyltransferase